MKERKTKQKNMSFTPQILSELEEICAKEMRSEQNMVEVLIHDRFVKTQLIQNAVDAEKGQVQGS
jgi:hypothetical protein